MRETVEETKPVWGVAVAAYVCGWLSIACGMLAAGGEPQRYSLDKYPLAETEIALEVVAWKLNVLGFWLVGIGFLVLGALLRVVEVLRGRR